MHIEFDRYNDANLRADADRLLLAEAGRERGEQLEVKDGADDANADGAEGEGVCAAAAPNAASIVVDAGTVEKAKDFEKKDTSVPSDGLSSIMSVRAGWHQRVTYSLGAGIQSNMVVPATVVISFMKSLEAWLWMNYRSRPPTSTQSSRLGSDQGLDKILVDSSGARAGLFVREMPDVRTQLNYVGQITTTPTQHSLLACECWDMRFYVDGTEHKHATKETFVPAWSVPLAADPKSQVAKSKPKAQVQEKAKGPKHLVMEMVRVQSDGFTFAWSYGAKPQTEKPKVNLYSLVLPPCDDCFFDKGAIPLKRKMAPDYFPSKDEVTRVMAVQAAAKKAAQELRASLAAFKTTRKAGGAPAAKPPSAEAPPGFEHCAHLFQ